MKLFNIIKRIIKRIIFSIKNSLIINISKIFLFFRDLSIPLNQHMICLSLFYVLFPSYFLRCFFFLLLSAMILGKGGMITNEVFSRSWIKWNLCLTTKVPAIVSESQREKLV